MPKDINEMSVPELKQLYSTLDDDNSSPEQRAALNDFIIEKMVDERVDAAMGRVEKVGKAKELDGIAKKRWPQLADLESDFAKRVEAELEARGDADSNPRALLDAANAVGYELGEVPAGFKPSETSRKNFAIKPSGDPDAPGDGSAKFVDKHKNVFNRLMKEGYLKEADAEKINEKVAGGND